MKKTLILFSIVLLFSSIKISAYTGEIEKSINTPGLFSTGLTFDGENLWLADRKTDSLYCINKETGRVVRAISSPAYWPMGLTWDGTSLWNIDVKGGIPLAENYNGKIYKIDPKNGRILHTIQAPTNKPIGLTWDGKYLWCTDSRSYEIIQFDPSDGTTIKTIKSPSYNPQGLTFDGKYLWVSDRSSNKIYMIDPKSGCVIIVADAPGNYSRGLCYDGEAIWNVDYEDNKIYKLKIRDKETHQLYNERRAILNYSHLTTNFGPGSVKTLDAHLAIPVDRPNQKINNISFSSNLTDKVTDKWGQKTAHFHKNDIKSGNSFEASMKVDVTSWNIRYFIYPENVGSFEDIPEKVKSIYLENNEKYQYDDPVIKNALSKIIDKEDNPYWTARKIFNYLIDNMYYEMLGGWNTAPTVLERGNGSCSEYAFVFISMCRAAGIPARYVGSVSLRGDDKSMDDVFHRWTEIYLPNYGWIPVDPSGGDRSMPGEQANYFGSLSNNYCITTQSGGGSKTMKWTYNSNEFWTCDPKTNVVIEYFGDWEPYTK